MRGRGHILLLILFVTVLLIGLAKYFIEKDTVQTEKTRLNSFSENLTIQKNNILSSFQNSASLMYSEMIRDSALLLLLDKTSKAHSAESTNNQTNLEKHTLPYYNNLSKIGLSSLIFILKQSQTFLIFNAGNGICVKGTPKFEKIIPSNFENFPITGTNICKGLIGYHYIFPILSINKNTPTANVAMGFDFHSMQSMLTNNLPDTKVGFLIFSPNKTLTDSINNNNLFNEKGFSEVSLTDYEFGKKILPTIHENVRKQIISLLNDASKNNKPDQFSIYTNPQKFDVLSFSELSYLGNEASVFLISYCSDQVMLKTKKRNNQLFIILLMLLLLAMTGIMYHYVNRVNMLKEKADIENSELKLIELNKSKDKFFSILAHDLKNPFNGIMGMSEYLNNSYHEIDDDERKEIINDINISSKNAFNLLQNLLEWTRTQSGQIKNVPVKIDPKSIIDLSLETVLNLAKNKEIEIVQTLQTDKTGFADENLVSTVLRNLFTNAVKFSDRNSVIEVVVKHFKNELVFCVKDSGIGLRSDEIDKLFRIDINFHKKGTEDETGTGLGLKLCKEFVEYCHGRIWVISEPKVGSSFFFTIPVY